MRFVALALTIAACNSTPTAAPNRACAGVAVLVPTAKCAAKGSVDVALVTLDDGAQLNCSAGTTVPFACKPVEKPASPGTGTAVQAAPARPTAAEAASPPAPAPASSPPAH